MRARLRLALLVQSLAVAAITGGILAAVGLPLAARGALSVRAYQVLVLLATLSTLGTTALCLLRWVGRPVDRLLDAAARVGPSAGALPTIGPPGDDSGAGLTRATVAFERTAAALAEERERLREKVLQLERTNQDLVAAREDLLQSERLAAVGRLAAGIAHEVGNPLGAITGYAELARSQIEQGGDRARIADYLGRISAETGRIDLIVRDLLDFARPARLELGPVHVPATLEAALRLARVQARFRNVTVTTELPADLPAARADARRLAQVFLNLLLNAADAMAGEGRVCISARAVPGWVEIDVADEGPGVAPETLPKLFEPFFTTKAPGEGSGLGLAVCHGIVESFGGTIRAENRERGATFLLRLPAA